jgi:oxygen-independent coproporphyrinogen-3 oxidase
MTQIPQLAQFGLFAARAPRYTSYPTAPHFGTTVGEADFINWIKAIAPYSEISLYLHVPFCRRLCWFCACRTQGTSTNDPVIAYVRALHAEIALLRQYLPQGVTLSRLHWGGGTPTILPPDLIRDLSSAIFQLAPLTGEFSVEIDPNEIDAPRLDALIAAGMNRASIGVQDFDPAVQAAIGRIQSFDLTRDVAQMIRARGVTSLNVDILYGLPHQTQARISHSVEQLLSLRPDRVALYGYAHVPWMSRRQQMIPAEAMPSPEERLQLFETATDLLIADGFVPLGIDHFALPGDGLAQAQAAGKMRRNFQGYTDDQSPVLIGLGASSISKFPQGYAQNAARTADYSTAVLGGHFPVHRGHIFDQDDLLRAVMIEELMCNFSILRDKVTARLGGIPANFAPLLAQAAQEFDGMVTLDAAGLHVLPIGQPLTRLIARSFDSYDQSRAQHSAAI